MIAGPSVPDAPCETSKMAFFPVFLSVVVVVRNHSDHLEALLREAAGCVETLVSDYELIVIDNASTDDSVETLTRLTGAAGIANVQVFVLTKEVDTDTATWVGLENALGDFVVCLDPTLDDIAFLPTMLDKAASGADVVFAHNKVAAPQKFVYRTASAVFDALYVRLNGVHLATEAPQYRVLNKKVVNFLLRHRQPSLIYRHLPATAGFVRANLNYSAAPRQGRDKHLMASIDRGMRLLVSNTRAPMRLVTGLSLFGALANLLYSIFVVGVGLFKADVAPGWVSLSLQQSGMFLLISLVLLVLGEYLLQMASLSNEGPLYYIGQEMTSARITRREKLNIEEVLPATAALAPSVPRRA